MLEKMLDKVNIPFYHFANTGMFWMFSDLSETRINVEKVDWKIQLKSFRKTLHDPSLDICLFRTLREHSEHVSCLLGLLMNSKAWAAPSNPHKISYLSWSRWHEFVVSVSLWWCCIALLRARCPSWRCSDPPLLWETSCSLPTPLHTSDTGSSTTTSR